MPLSVIIRLEALGDAPLDQFTGRGVHGFWFQRWREVDEKLGDELHESDEAPPFTLSPLMGLPKDRRGVTQLQAGATAFLRVTALSDSLSESIKAKWLAGLDAGRVIQIPQDQERDGVLIQKGIEWRIARCEIESETAYPAFATPRLMNSNPPREWKMKFLTPTTFHGKSAHLPFPLPDSLAASWLRRWNAFAPIALPDEVVTWAREKLAVSSYDLRTLPAREGERLRVGCVGRLTLRALEMPPYLRAAVDVLANYAFYCGSGSHTAQGLGQTVRV
jgi:CRISPR-associated endoribonuclease Cas6